MKRIILLTLIFIGMALSLNAQTFTSFYSDHKARQPGDLVTVLVTEFAQASNQAKTETKAEESNSANLSQGTGALNFFPEMSFGGGLNNSYSGSGTNSRTGSLKGKITVRIDSILPGGAYVVSGKRIVDANKEKQIMKLSGVVRPRDIQADNTVYSYLIADAEITYEGRGVVAAAHKPGIIMRILNWVF